MKIIERFSPARLQRMAKDAGGSLLSAEDYGKFSASNLAKARARLANPLVAGLLEVINQPAYDSTSFAAAAAMAKTVFFQTPIGQGGKTLALTNMTKAGQLEQPQKLVIRAIRLFLANNTAPVDVDNFLLNCSFVLTLGKKPMLECPALLLQAGCGRSTTAVAQVGTAPAGSAVVAHTSNGIPDPRSVFTLNQPITLEGGEGFSATINPETAFNFSAAAANPPGNGTSIVIFLDGELYRGVQ